jgi:hypothetical protein
MPNSRPTPAALGPPPRKVRPISKQRNDMRILYLFLLPFYLAALLFSAHIILSLLTPVLGTAIPAFTSQTSLDFDDDHHPTYKLHYTYQRHNQTIQANAKIEKQDYDQYNTQPHPQSIIIHHLNLGIFSYTTPNTLSSQASRLFCAILAALFFNVSCYAMFHFSWLTNHRARRLYQRGFPAPGFIVSKRKVDDSDSPHCYITYTYTHPDSAQPVTTEQLIDNDLWDTIPINQPVTVLYDPAKPSRTLVYEYSGYEIITVL